MLLWREVGAAAVLSIRSISMHSRLPCQSFQRSCRAPHSSLCRATTMAGHLPSLPVQQHRYHAEAYPTCSHLGSKEPPQVPTPRQRKSEDPKQTAKLFGPPTPPGSPYSAPPTR